MTVPAIGVTIVVNVFIFKTSSAPAFIIFNFISGRHVAAFEIDPTNSVTLTEEVPKASSLGGTAGFNSVVVAFLD